jgi:membrane fusion protein, copper/silver efflux system
MKRSQLVIVLLLIGTAFFAGYLLSQRNATKTGNAGGRKVLYFVDPMNPGFRSDKPGIAPCGMQLEPVYDGDAAVKESGALPPGVVRVAPDRQQLIGVKVVTVESAPSSHTIRVLGRVVPDETRIYRVNAATDGWVKKILPVTTDSLVAKDELLATFYAPEFFSAMKAYLYGLRALDRFEASQTETKEQLEQTGTSIDNYRNSLRNLGMTEHQMDEIMRTRKGGDQVEIRAPEAGFILVRNITLGQRFERGSELYRIADLSKVWILADMFSTEASSFEPGMQVRVSSPNLKNAFFAQVANVLPRFDPNSRALQVRLEADNPRLLLRPDMFVDVELPMNSPAAITVPVDAIIETGLKKTVYIDIGGGYFEPRLVETGWRLGKQVEITGGLMNGEKVVVSGNFLIDSESRLKTSTAGNPNEQHKDLVCGMYLDEKKVRTAGETSDFEGQTYFFCSEECKRFFEKNPQKYVDRDVRKPAQTVLPVLPAPGMEMPGLEKKPGGPVPGDQNATADRGEDEPMSRMEEHPDRRNTSLQPAIPPDNMDLRRMRRRRGGPISSGQPVMPAQKKDEQTPPMGEPTDHQDTPQPPATPSHNHD